MTTLGYILIALAVFPSLLLKKKTIESLGKVSYPVFGIGWILVGIGNFTGGTMIGSRREYNVFNSYTMRETWTMESDPVPFVISNVAFILIGVGTIIWSFLRKKT
ncbi:hypothetical protein [Marinobacter confluentis]|uniref:Uncharacterized protein n=1 Tax=Marinobacter confluentis TaxID=1697557 RepID=A0A4Z1C9Y3_9GAMM|nr:hypothetical protein [Marinobacter confluentis]TGN40276.1 hypothetical protein E5Q11_08310 [Marinobacter confluentis]